MESAARAILRLPRKHSEPINRMLNDVFGQCGLSDAVQEFEKVSIAYSVSVDQAWTVALELKRKIHSTAELDSMLKSGQFRSANLEFVATSLTTSPLMYGRRIAYTIRVTDGYRRRSRPLTYTSAYICEVPEVFGGLKSADSLEDEVRIMNSTPIEKGTVDVTIYDNNAPSASALAELQSKYAPLGTVSFEPCGDTVRGADGTPS